MKNRFLPFWVLTFAAMLGLTLPVLVQNSMFGDAVLYTCVSRNLGEGKGTFWFPQYSTLNVGGLSSFHEHPPLAFGIQSLFFKLLGDHIYVERLYVFITFVIASLLIVRIWNVHFKTENSMRKYSWVALMLWVSSPVVFWGYSNNMQENTLSIFCLLSILSLVYNYTLERPRFVYFLLAGLFIFLATLTKGIPGFFPIAIPLVHWLIYRKQKLTKAILNTFIVAAVPLIIYGILIQDASIRQSLSMYVFDRLLHRVQQDPTTGFRFYSLFRTLTELIPSFIIVAIILVIAYLCKPKMEIRHPYKSVLFFLLTGACYVMPLMLTMVQKGMYLTPAFPYLSMALALIIIPYLDVWIMKINLQSIGQKSFLTISIVLLCGVLAYSFKQAGKIPQSQSLIRDAYRIGTVVPANSTITIPNGMYYDNDFVMPGFLMRYDHISLSPYKQYDYYLQAKDYPMPDPKHFKKVDLYTESWDLYKYQL